MKHRRLSNAQASALACLSLLILGSPWDVLGVPPPSQGPASPSNLGERVAELEHKVQFLSRTGTEYLLEGTNLRIRNGLGETESTNGRGNLLMGYGDVSGSHNLVAGTGNSCSSYGGIAAGRNNEVAAPWASVLGGSFHLITGSNSTIVGGFSNEISGSRSTIVGGQSHLIQGDRSLVMGGDGHQVEGDHSTVRGGLLHRITSNGACVAGGRDHVLSGLEAAIMGGRQIFAHPLRGAHGGGGYHVDSTPQDSVPSSLLAGGEGLLVVGDRAVAVGGSQGNAQGLLSSVVGGVGGFVVGQTLYGVLVGGEGNTMDAPYGTITGGYQGSCTGSQATISGGRERWVSDTDGWVAGSLFEGE